MAGGMSTAGELLYSIGGKCVRPVYWAFLLGVSDGSCSTQPQLTLRAMSLIDINYSFIIKEGLDFPDKERVTVISCSPFLNPHESGLDEYVAATGYPTVTHKTARIFSEYAIKNLLNMQLQFDECVHSGKIPLMIVPYWLASYVPKTWSVIPLIATAEQPQKVFADTFAPKPSVGGTFGRTVHLAADSSHFDRVYLGQPSCSQSVGTIPMPTSTMNAFYQGENESYRSCRSGYFRDTKSYLEGAVYRGDEKLVIVYDGTSQAKVHPRCSTAYGNWLKSAFGDGAWYNRHPRGDEKKAFVDVLTKSWSLMYAPQASCGAILVKGDQRLDLMVNISKLYMEGRPFVGFDDKVMSIGKRIRDHRPPIRLVRSGKLLSVLPGKEVCVISTQNDKGKLPIGFADGRRSSSWSIMCTSKFYERIASDDVLTTLKFVPVKVLPKGLVDPRGTSHGVLKHHLMTKGVFVLDLSVYGGAVVKTVRVFDKGGNEFLPFKLTPKGNASLISLIQEHMQGSNTVMMRDTDLIADDTHDVFTGRKFMLETEKGERRIVLPRSEICEKTLYYKSMLGRPVSFLSPDGIGAVVDEFANDTRFLLPNHPTIRLDTKDHKTGRAKNFGGLNSLFIPSPDQVPVIPVNMAGCWRNSYECVHRVIDSPLGRLSGMSNADLPLTSFVMNQQTDDLMICDHPHVMERHAAQRRSSDSNEFLVLSPLTPGMSWVSTMVTSIFHKGRVDASVGPLGNARFKLIGDLCVFKLNGIEIIAMNGAMAGPLTHAETIGPLVVHAPSRLESKPRVLMIVASDDVSLDIIALTLNKRGLKTAIIPFEETNQFGEFHDPVRHVEWKTSNEDTLVFITSLNDSLVRRISQRNSTGVNPFSSRLSLVTLARLSNSHETFGVNHSSLGIFNDTDWTSYTVCSGGNYMFADCWCGLGADLSLSSVDDIANHLLGIYSTARSSQRWTYHSGMTWPMAVRSYSKGFVSIDPYNSTATSRLVGSVDLSIGTSHKESQFNSICDRLKHVYIQNVRLTKPLIGFGSMSGHLRIAISFGGLPELCHAMRSLLSSLHGGVKVGVTVSEAKDPKPYHSLLDIALTVVACDKAGVTRSVEMVIKAFCALHNESEWEATLALAYRV